ncbi:MAG: ATP-binding protein [Firmicutes bacterium]|nr:ATP-binding protein [Bacillota bacterium]MDH7496780.1 ATP-binding protein [Bacillota bacterium]
MKELLVVSGKGGTGKTSLVGAFAVLAENKVLADCDVDASDLHLLLKPQVRETKEFYGSKKAVLHSERCNGCLVCVDVCRFGAISVGRSGRRSVLQGEIRIDPVSCEGCAVCSHACPQGAITMAENLSGHWFISDTPYGPLVHARLGVAEENSGKLVTQVRRQARSIAEERGSGYIITDGPPGIGCPVISSISGVDLALIVTEPTVAGSHDMARILELARHFGVNAMVCINKYDLDEGRTEDIERYCRREGIRLAGRIPFDEEVVNALARGAPAVMSPAGAGRTEGRASRAMREVWTEVSSRLG